MTEPAFTVALAAFNEEDWIADAIRSVQAQTRDDFELIVVDDGSSDGTAEVVRGFESDSRIRLVSQQNKGLAGALNTAIGAGGAPYVSLIDADDLWMPGYLEGMGRALDEDPEAGFAYSDGWSYVVERRRFWRLGVIEEMIEQMGAPDPPPRDPEELLRQLLELNFVFGLATIRRTALERVGGFDESLRACEDYELWLRLAANGYRAVKAPGLLAVLRDRAGAMHSDQRNMLTQMRKVCRKVIDDYESSEEVKGRARDRIAALDRQEQRLDRGAVTTRAWLSLRGRLGEARKKLFGRRMWYPGTPPEVAAAFPELARHQQGAD